MNNIERLYEVWKQFKILYNFSISRALSLKKLKSNQQDLYIPHFSIFEKYKQKLTFLSKAHNSLKFQPILKNLEIGVLMKLSLLA